MADEGRSKRAKPNKRYDNSELKKALENKGKTSSALDSLEFEEDNVFDVLDEDEYAQLVESRRNGQDFVVDDEGLGYYDDGEEHLDNHEAKKRLQDISDELDKKMAKKARKLGEAGAAQRNALMPFVRTGASNIRETSNVTASNVEALDIDSLLGADSAKPGKNKIYHAPAVPSKPVIHGQYLALNNFSMTAPQRHAPSFPMSRPVHAAYNIGVDDLDTNQLLEPGNNVAYDDTFVHTAGDVEEYAEAETKTESFEKISITKTTKKLNVAAYAPVARKAEKPATFKQEVVDYDAGSDTALTLAAIGSGFGSQESETTTENTSSVIDPKLWLLKTTSGVDASGNEIPTEEYVNMYWIDACENQGIIYLFGKIPLTSDSNTRSKKYVSGCVAVHGSERNLFVLPAVLPGQFKDGKPVRRDLNSVYQDISKLLVPNIIPRSQGQSFGVKPVKRKYAFELEGIPREETEYLKVKYSARHGAPSAVQCQAQGSIERIFGATSSPLELFLLKRGLSGPGWIRIKNVRTMQDPVSWCKIEIGVESPKFIEKVTLDETPPLVLMSVSMKTAVNPSTHIHEIMSISGLIHTNVEPDADTDIRNTNSMKRFTFIRQLGTSCGSAYPAAFPHDLQSELKKHGSGVLISFPNERALLNSFFARIHSEDPDLIASHNLFGFEFDVLLSRSIENKINVWSKLGRLRRTKPPKSIAERDIASGRIFCDTYKAAKEFLRETNYSLTNLSQSQLRYERVDVDPIEVPKYYFNSSDLLKLMHHTSTDAFLVLSLVLKLQVVPLTKQLTNLSGNLWSRTMRGARAERIEYLLLHEFHDLKYILPERKQFEDKAKTKKRNAEAGDDDDDDNHKVGGTAKSRGKAGYAGGLVLEPKKGLYDTYILLLDYNSLYPSIIQEYNLCFTTINWPLYTPKEQKQTPSGNSKKKGVEDAEDDDEEGGDDGEGGDREGNKALPPVPDPSTEEGILPRVIKTLVDRRRAVKGLLKGEKDPMIRQQLDIRQKALKLTANSMYGCLGFAFSRFYARPIAALVTSMGREALTRTVNLATNQFGLDVIYGDTDSVMINTNSTDLAVVKALGGKVKREVNKMYKCLELDIDGIFKSMLLLKKKKYAAVVIKEDQDGNVSYEHEMKGLDLVRRDWCPLSKEAGRFIVEQILSGNTREEIVMAIHNFLTELGSTIREKDLARFVITKGLNKNPKDYPDCSGQAHLQVALAMLKANKSVNIGDHIPYLICVQGPKENCEATLRAYHPDDVIRSNGELTIDYDWYLTNQILPPISRLCEPIEGASSVMLASCLGIKAPVGQHRVENDSEDNWGFTALCQMDDAERFRNCEDLYLCCSNCGIESPFAGVYSTTGQSGLLCPCCSSPFYGRKKCIHRYYESWLVCDDPACGRRTMQLFLSGLACIENCHGRMIQEYDEAALHNQLKKIESLVDYKRQNEKKKADPSQSVIELPTSHQQVLAMLYAHMENCISDSAYNWVRPSLWTSLFERPAPK